MWSSFQTLDAATEKARLSKLSLVLGKISCCEMDDLCCLKILRNTMARRHYNCQYHIAISSSSSNVLPSLNILHLKSWTMTCLNVALKCIQTVYTNSVLGEGVPDCLH